MALEHRAVGAFDHYFAAITAKLIEPTEGKGATIASIQNKDQRANIIDVASTMAREMLAARDKIVQLPGSIVAEPKDK